MYSHILRTMHYQIKYKGKPKQKQILTKTGEITFDGEIYVIVKERKCAIPQKLLIPYKN